MGVPGRGTLQKDVGCYRAVELPPGSDSVTLGANEELRGKRKGAEQSLEFPL